MTCEDCLALLVLCASTRQATIMLTFSDALYLRLSIAGRIFLNMTKNGARPDQISLTPELSQNNFKSVSISIF